MKAHNVRLPLLVLIFGLTLSMLACSLVRQWEENQIAKEISFRSESRMVAFKSAIAGVLDSGFHVGAAIRNELLSETEHGFTKDEFVNFINNYLTDDERLGMRSIAWIPKEEVPGQERFEYKVQYSQYESAFGVKPGVDIEANPTHFEHIRQAIESGEVALDMHLDRKSHQVISLFTPFFDNVNAPADSLGEKYLLGVVYSEWDVGELLQATQLLLPEGGLDFHLHELKPNGEMAPIFFHQSGVSTPEKNDEFKPAWKEPFWVAEHEWQLSSAPSSEFTRSHPVVLAWLVILFGVLVSVVVAIYIWRVSLRSQLIEKEVELRTVEVKLNQKKLEESQKIAKLGGWEWIISTGELKWSDGACRVFGHDPQTCEISYDRFLDLVHPDDRERLINAIAMALEGEKYNIVHRIVLPDGAIRAVHEQGNLECDSAGKPVRMVGTVQDITEQRRAERRLNRLAMALAETAESVVITNTEGEIRYVNRAFEKMSGYTADEVVGKRPNIVKSGEHPDEYYAVMWEKISNGEAWFGTFTNKDKSGEKYTVEQTISPIHDMQGDITGYVAVQRDVTGEREQREKMEHTQRLESLGILAGGIAHDFNNLLTAIMGNASLAKAKESLDEVEVHLDRIEMASERAAELCRQMLAYSGQGDYVWEWFDLNHRIHDMVELLQVSLSKSVKLNIHLNAPPCEVYGDTSQIQQVVMNLVINASEAIDELGKTGEIELATECVEMVEDDFRNCLYHDVVTPEAGCYFCLTVSDNGCGMNEETRLKLFDPFFTTKFTGRGLGTSAMLGIVKSHHGALHVETAVAVGTTFKVYLPCKVAANVPANPVTESAGKRGGLVDLQGHTILLVDDEPVVLDIIARMVDSFGCNTLSAPSGYDAIELYRKHGDKITATIIDMTMPDMDGLSCAEKILEINPKALITISSGYSEDLLAERTEGVFISGFLQKPYSAQQLHQALNKLLLPD